MINLFNHVFLTNKIHLRYLTTNLIDFLCGLFISSSEVYSIVNGVLSTVPWYNCVRLRSN